MTIERDVFRRECRRLDLTDSQADCIWLLANGLRSHEIAEELHKQKSTVNHHLYTARKKTGATSNAQLVSIVKHRLFVVGAGKPELLRAA